MMLVLLFRVLPMRLPLLAGGRCLPVVSTPPLFPPSLASSLGLPNEFVLLLPPLWSPFPACLCCLDWVLWLWSVLSAVNSYCCLSGDCSTRCLIWVCAAYRSLVL